MNHIDLNAETIYWETQNDWSRMHDDGRMEYGFGVFLPRTAVLMQMATQIAKGELYRARLEIECHGDRDLYNDVWKDQSGWMNGHPYEHLDLKINSKIDYTGHLAWFIYAREIGNDNPFSSWTYMAPDFALAWFIAAAWENHNEWMSEQLFVTGGLS